MHESIEQCKITEQPTACLQAGGMNCDSIGREPDSEPAKRGSGTARQAKSRLRKKQGESPRSGGAALRDKQKSSAEGAGREPAKWEGLYCMLNEERVKQMTKIAMFEQREKRDILPMMHYGKRDYLALHLILCFLAGTVFYLLLYGGIVMLLIWFVIPNLSTMTLILGAVLGILGYIVYLYIYLRLMYQKAQKRYREGRQKIKKLAAEYRVLEEMYQQEEETETPEGWK